MPALSFYEHLNENYDVYLVSDLRGSRFIDKEIYKNKIIDVPDIKKNILKVPLNIIFFLISIIKSFIYLKKNKISKIISTGGYMTLPICIASRFTKSKLFLFEPNMVLGRSNLFFTNQCQKILCYSDKVRKFPIKHLDKIQTVYPVFKKKTYLIKTKNNNSSDKKILLIIGGSQGANFFQTDLRETIYKLGKRFDFSIYHQANKDNYKNLEFFYKKNNIDFNLFDFNYSLDNIFKKTNFCITRAGASTLAELVHFGVPFLTIPFPYSKDNHQFYNAKFYKDHNCCWLLEQKDIFKKNLYEIISNMILDRKDIQLKKKAMNKISLKNSWEKNNKLILKTVYEN